MRPLTALTILMLAPLLLAGEAAENFDEAMQRVGRAAAARDFDKAREMLRGALPLAKTPEQRFQIYCAIGGFFQLQDRRPEARDAFRDALGIAGISPDRRFWTYKLMAMTWEAEKKPAEVRATYTKALQEDLSLPVRCLALAGLASAWRNEGKPEKAKSAYAELLKAAEAAADSQWVTHAHRSTGAILAEQGDFAAALEAYEKALSARGGSEVFICLDVGRALIGLKRYSDARLVLSTITEDKHVVPFFMRHAALMLTAEALEAEGKLTEAEQIKEQLLKGGVPTDASPEFDPHADLARQRNIRAASFLAIGRLYLDKGDKNKARETFTRIVEMEGAPAEYREKARAHLDAMD